MDKGVVGAANRDTAAVGELPYGVILRQLCRKVGRKLFGRRAARLENRPQDQKKPWEQYDELTVGDAVIQLMQKWPNKLVRRRDARALQRRLGLMEGLRAELAAAMGHAAAEGRCTVAVFAPHPQVEGLNDGYAQRITDVDTTLLDCGCLRIYVCDSSLPLESGDALWIAKSEDGTFYLKYVPENEAHRAMLLQLVNAARFVYVHSVLRVHPALFQGISIPKVLDIHGAVPEEARLNGDMVAFFVQNRNEAYAVKHFDAFVFITNTQQEQLREKYGLEELRGWVLPAYNEYSMPKGDAPPAFERAGPVTAVYAGGAQRWQMVDTMLQAMAAKKDCEYRIFSQNIDVFCDCCAELGLDIPVQCVPTAQLMETYKTVHYGFVLREDITVNNVAGPTKLTEYCTHGVVPVLNTPRIGDFVAMGMQYIPLADFMKGKLPKETERAKMARNNYEVAKKMIEVYERGRSSLQAYIAGMGQN